jgi:DNA-directed RNA polymerase specialized sigma24 family protein
MAAQPRPKTATDRRGQMLCHLLEREGPVLRRQARLHAQRPADAEDALQDACVQFIRYYDGPASEAVLWMQVVVKRCAWAIAPSQPGPRGGLRASLAQRRG